MAKRAGIWRWMRDWWRTGGGATVSGTRVKFVAANGATATNNSVATPIGDGKYTVEVAYRSDSDVTMKVGYSRYRNLNGTSTISPDPTALDKVLPASPTTNTVTFDVDLNTGGGVQAWRPVLRFNAPITVEEVQVYPRLHDGEAGQPLDPGRVRSFDTIAVSGQPRAGRLSAQSTAGDTALLFVSSGWGSLPYRPPTGWDFRVSLAAGASGRSGYVAALKVSDPAQTQDVNPWGPGTDSPSTARDQAALVVVTGSELFPQFQEWDDKLPPKPASGSWFLASQLHAIASVPDEFWEAPGSHQIVSGGRSTEASWSALHVQRVESEPTLTEGATHPAAWAGVVLAPRPNEHRLTVWDGREEVPAKMRAMPRGCRTVEELLAKKGFIVAHRGGSASWPEMSMRAYTNAVQHGVDALEVSAQKTTDGVWVCVHDRNLKRVDPTAPDTPVTDLPYSEVKKYKTMGEPIALLDDVIDAYASSHVLVVDPKYSAQHHGEFLKKFNKDTTIAKFSGDSKWLADAFRAAGFKSWGYAYSSHIANGQYAQWADWWDFLGMEITTDASIFQQALTQAKGKPVWGHIIPNRQWYDTMMARGAVGCMVSGVDSVLPEELV